uniref:HTH_48 domain-containing protein n=1 Tax=Panagrellus redivivus TaxID=6233 RepID=A0A7E4VLA2_PANRE
MDDGSDKKQPPLSRILLTDARVLFYVDAFVLKKLYGSDAPFDCTQVENLKRLAGSISAEFPNHKPVSRTTVQYWFQKREELRAEGKISNKYWQALTEELCRKWPLKTIPKSSQIASDIPPPFDNTVSDFLPTLKKTQQSNTPGIPIAAFYYGYTDKSGDKTLCYTYDESNPNRVKVYTQKNAY